MCPVIQRFSINFQNGTHLQCLQETNSVRVFAAVSSNSSVTRVKVTILYQHYHKYENLKIKCLLWIHFQLRYSEESRQNNSLAVTSFRASKWRREKKIFIRLEKYLQEKMEMKEGMFGERRKWKNFLIPQHFIVCKC